MWRRRADRAFLAICVCEQAAEVGRRFFHHGATSLRRPIAPIVTPFPLLVFHLGQREQLGAEWGKLVFRFSAKMSQARTMGAVKSKDLRLSSLEPILP